MFNNDVAQTYDHLDASAEILIMLAGAFILGCILCWLLRKYLVDNNTTRASEGFYDANIQSFANNSQAQSSKQYPTNNLVKNKTSNQKQCSDFTIINGISPKIESALREKNINSYSDLRDADKKILKELQNSSLLDAPTKTTVKTWPHQATLASKGDWRKLSEYQDFIDQTMLAKESLSIDKKNDNLQKIQGIDPKIENILNKKGIHTYKQLKKADATTLKEYISSADSRYKNNQTATWAHQANLADKSHWKELSIYQEFMNDINIDSNNLAATINNTKSSHTPHKQDFVNASTPSLVISDIPDSTKKQQLEHDGENNKQNTSNNNKQTPLVTVRNDVTSSVASEISAETKGKTATTHIRQHALISKISDHEKRQDELIRLEGIDSDIEKLLNTNGVYTFKQLHKYDRSALKTILSNAGSKFNVQDSKTWPHQAGMAARGEWNELKTYQSYIAKDNSISITPKKKSDDNTKKDNLKVIEGIGPKIESVLNGANILTFNDLKHSNRDTLKSLLNKAGPQYRMHEPETWPTQAKIANTKDWKKLEKYQNSLIAGRE